MLVTLWGDFASRDNPFHDLRQGIARYAGVVDAQGEAHNDRDKILPTTDYTLRLAKRDYARQHEHSADAIRFDFGRFNQPTTDLDSMLTALAFDGGPQFVRTVDDLFSVERFIESALAEVAATWRRLAVKLDGLIVGAAEGTNDGGKRSYAVEVDVDYPPAGPNATVFGDRLRLTKQQWRILRRLQHAREEGRRLSLNELRGSGIKGDTLDDDASRIAKKINDEIGKGHPLIDMPGRGNRGRGYALN